MSSYTFVDSRVPDYDRLLANRVPDGGTVILDSSTDGIDQIVAALTNVTGLEAIHIVSHGAEGTLYLGSTVLSSANVANYSSQLAMIGAALGSDGDILLYGCNVASGTSGRNFIDDLARHTGADVAASLDATGGTALGGNWVLESSTGPIEAHSLSSPTYEALLATPVITITDVTVGEIDGFARFTVRLSESSASTVSVNYSTSNGTAAGGNVDYVSTGSQTLNFAPGQLEKFVDVAIVDDGNVEPTQNFVLGLSSPTNAVIGRSFGIATIVDNDAVSGTPVVSITDFVVDEQDKEASFVITLDRPSTGAVSMSYATANGTALAGSDYVATSGTVSFAAGETAKTVKVTLINDADSELSESFNLVLSGLSGGTTLDGTGTAIIAENDAPTVNTPYLTVDDVTVGESQPYADFLVRLNAPSASTVSVNYATFNSTAAGGNVDYVSTGSQTLNFAPGEMVKTVRVSIINDGGVEATENFALGLSSPTNAVIGRSFGIATIVDNDAVSGTPVVSITDFVVDEQDREASFVITLDRPSAGAVSMSYATADGTAVAGSDYVATSGTVSFAAGETAKTVKVTLINDADSELSESFNLVLSGLSGGTTLDGTGTAIIAENDAPTVNTPYLTVDDVTVGESQPYADFLVRLNAPSASTVSVNYATFNSTAAGGNVDYVSTGSQTLNFAPGEMVKTVRVSIINDGGVEATENFALGLSSPTNAVIGRSFGIATIVDNDAVSGTPVVSITDFVVDEQDREASFVITLDRPSAGAVSMSYATANGTALAGSDYVATSGTVSFAAGETAKTVKVTLINDADSELSESFNLVLSGLSGGTTLDGTGTAIIAENDAPTVNTPYLTVDDVTVGESQPYADFLVRLNAPSASTVSVNYATFNSTAAGGNVDYVSTGSQTLNFAPGEMVKTVRVSIINDGGVEATENFALGLSSPTNAVIGRSFGTATIIDNDAVSGTPVVSITDFVVDEQDKEASFVITLDRPSTGAVTMSYATADGTALAGSDYVAASGTVSFAAGETAKTVKVTLINDADSELSESFNLVLSGLSGGTTLDGTGTAIIAENDAPTVNTPYLTVDDVTVGESQPYADFLVRLNAPSASTVSVNYATFNSTAAGGNVDYVSTGSQTLNFAPGEMVKTVRVSIINDGGVEATENFALGLSSPTNAVIGRSFGIATIVDNDAVSGTPVVSITDFVVDEQDREASFVITLDRPSTGAVSMSYATANGTALAGSDYVATSGTVSFAAGETAKTVKVTLINDADSELSESFNLVLSGLSGGTTLDGTGTAIIAENDAPTVNTPYLTVDDVTVGESQPYADFLVRLNAPSASTVSVNYATFNSTAAGGNVDYVSTGSQTLNFAPGEMVKTVRVSIINDGGVEATENFALGLSSPTNAVIGRSFGTATIIDNDAVSGTPVVNVRDTVVDEKDNAARVVLTLDRPSTSPVTMNIGVQDLNATAGSDYVVFPGQIISFAPGETAKTFVIGLVDDGLAEPTEAFDVIVSNVAGATVGDGTGRVYIAANDAAALIAPVVTVANATASENFGFLDFLVALNGPGTNPVSVNYATSNGTAAGGNVDYVSTGSQTLNFAPGETVKTVRVSLINDVAAESTENFVLNLSSPVNATLGNTSASGFIIDDDSAPPASVVINGTGGPDILRGTAFADTLAGGNGNDFLDGGSGADTASGGDGNDILTGGPGADMLTGGPGADLFLDTPANLDLDQLPDFTAEDLIDVAGVRFSGVRYTSSSGLLELDTADNGSYATRLTLPTGLSGAFSATPSPAGGAASTRIQLGSGTDTDGDGVPDIHDNAILVPNPDQRDTDGDGYGNVADPDLNNDKIINFADLALLKERFFGGNADADFNGDGVVNFADLAIMKAMFFGPPGPSYVDLPPPGVSPQGLTEELAIPDSGHVEVAIVGSTADVAG